MSLRITDLSFSYDENKKVLDRISFETKRGEVLGILGPNGTGKTTLLKCINGILKYQEGLVSFEDTNLSSLTSSELAKIIAYVPQYTNGSFPVNVVDTVLMGRIPYSQYYYSQLDKKIAFKIIEMMNLEDFSFRNIGEMSGGERQRVFIARALAQQPKIIIFDEPNSSLDLHNQLFILNTIIDIAKSNDICIIMTIHDLNLASMFCDKILMLKNAHIFAYGDAQQVITESNINEMYKVRTKVDIVDGYKYVRLLRDL